MESAVSLLHQIISMDAYNKVRSGFLLLGILLRNVICKKWIMFYKLITCFACKR